MVAFGGIEEYKDVTPREELHQTIAILRANNANLQAENERLKEKHAVEIVAAQRLCKIYFEILERYISTSQIRKIRDDKIDQALRTES